VVSRKKKPLSTWSICSRSNSARTASLVVFALLTIALTACGGGTEAAETSAGSTESAGSVRSIEITHKPAPIRAEKDLNPDQGGLVGSEPKLIIPTGKPPRFLAYQDLIEGEGKVAHWGDRVAIQYVGAEYKNGKQYTSSWDWGSPYEFEVGGAGLIRGFDLGVKGMRVGGRRELIVPPAFADPKGTVGGIPDRETVIYMVDLLAVT
jgi:peptidylprolyl isomerase